MHQKATQPVLFIPHGAGPCFFIDWNPPTTWNGMAEFLASVSTSLPEPPRAILMVSAHWLAPEFTVTSGQQPDLIYDYYGFPEHTYQLSYPAEGMPSLASEVVSRLKAAGIEAHEDAQRGFDHGMFIPLKLMFPEADIPVVQLSLKADMDPVSHQLDHGTPRPGLPSTTRRRTPDTTDGSGRCRRRGPGAHRLHRKRSENPAFGIPFRMTMA